MKKITELESKKLEKVLTTSRCREECFCLQNLLPPVAKVKSG